MLVTDGNHSWALTYFDVSHNQFTKFPDDLLAKMPDLRTLNASNNFLNRMPFLSGVGSALIYVSLQHNRIQHIQANHLVGLPNLETLNLTYNEITFVNTQALANLTNLLLIDLRYNNLWAQPILSVMRVSLHVNVSIGDNPYHCQWMCPLKNETFTTEGLICRSHRGVVNTNISSVLNVARCGKYCE